MSRGPKNPIFDLFITMAAIHKLNEGLYEDYVELIALHCNLEDYALAYSLNRYLKSSFKRRRDDLELTPRDTVPIYEWKNDANDSYWTLFANTVVGQETGLQDGIFKDAISITKHYVITEYRDVDYFIKIERDGLDNYRLTEQKRTLKSLLSVPRIITAYSVDTKELKSQNHLIF